MFQESPGVLLTPQLVLPLQDCCAFQLVPMWVGTPHHTTPISFRKRTLPIGVCCIVQHHGLESSHRVGGHGLRWHCHLLLHSGRLPCRHHLGGVGPSLSVSWESLLLHKLRCPLCIKGGYSHGPTVLLVSLSPENQGDQDPCHHMIPIVVAR